MAQTAIYQISQFLYLQNDAEGENSLIQINTDSEVEEGEIVSGLSESAETENSDEGLAVDGVDEDSIIVIDSDSDN